MDSVEHPPFSILNCPALRSNYTYLKKNNKNSNILIIDIPYYTPNLEGLTTDSFIGYGHRLYPLYWCNNKESEDENSCGACQCNEIGTTYYYCDGCEIAYHKECVESPLVIKSPYHLKHPLQLFIHHGFITSRDDFIILSCFSCNSKRRRYCLNLFYYCLICNFSMDPVCARRPSFLTYQKRHGHTLNYFPRKADLICDVCGIVDSKTFIYVCLQCDFIVHKNCIHLPFVIKISRHNHRLSFTYSPQRILFCGVCRQKVDQNYGKYSCLKDGCTYVAHSKCATRSDVWDGKELDQIPEEVHENLNPYEVIGDGIIQHFSHSHHMRFEKKITDITVYDENKQCQACVLPFYGGDVYKCMNSTCDFVLHEGCANLPRRKQHMAHPYPFILQVSDTNCFFCGYCDRFSCGFRYVCCEGAESISLDVRCAAISEPFYHPCHTHLLFLNNELGKSRPCSMCGKESVRTLNCIICDFFLCFYCATIPYKVRYEHDEHYLTLSYDENASLNWCEICEETLDSNKWLYTCNECGVVFHIACLIGKCAFYVKPTQDVLLDDAKFNIILNNGLTRSICDECGRRCQDKLMLHMVDDDNEEETRVCYRHWEIDSSAGNRLTA